VSSHSLMARRFSGTPRHRYRSFAFLVLAGCTSGSSPDGDQGDEPRTVSRTVYTEAVEHFTEHPLLVAGEPVKFTAHVTDIRGDFLPVRRGTLTLRAYRGGERVAEAPAMEPVRPGVFAPVLTLPAPGIVELRATIEAGDLRDEASLGDVQVHASREEAGSEPLAEEPFAPITLFKEQQWRIDFRSEPARRHRLVETLQVPGRVVPRPLGRAVVAAPARGRTLPVSSAGFVRLGDRVDEGMVLALLEPVLAGAEGTQLLAARSELEARGIAAEAEGVRARARLERARRLLERAERLRGKEALSERELEEARFQAELALHDLEAAKKLKTSYDEFRRARAGETALALSLKAPIGGVISTARAIAGEYVEAGTLLFEIVDPAALWIEGDVPELDLGRIGESPAASYRLAAGGSPPRAAGLSFLALGPAIDPETRAVRIIYALNEPPPDVRIGAAADLFIETRRVNEAVAVPLSAVVDDNGRPVVFVQLAGESFERRDVALGIRSGGLVELVSGVSAGECVVTKGAYAVRLQSLAASLPAHAHDH
jgi:cobalt-zinc-cadmium efflux system membrane fusion protein